MLSVLRWVLGAQKVRITAIVLSYCVFFGVQQFTPYVVGRALEDGIAGGHGLARWVLALAGIIAVVTATGYGGWVLLRKAGTEAVIQVERTMLRQICRLGGDTGRHFTAGEIVSIASADASRFENFITSIGLVGGSLFSYGVVVALVSVQSLQLATVVLVGMPVMLLCLRSSFRSLEARHGAQRTEMGKANSLLGDTVAGLRVLRGLGGERYFTARYGAASRAVRHEGEQVARSLGALEGAQVLLPGLLLFVVIWWGAHQAASGELSPGGFIAFYGYLTLLTRPLIFTIKGIGTFAHVRVASRRIHAFLAAEPPAHLRTEGTVGPEGPEGPEGPVGPLGPLGPLGTKETEGPVGTEGPDAPERSEGPEQEAAGWPATVRELTDHHSGTAIRSGCFTVLVDDVPLRSTATLERLSRHAVPAAHLDGLPLTSLPLDDVRARIHLLHHDAHLFSGDLHAQLDVAGRCSEREIIEALHTASALDIVGLDPALVEEDPAPDQPYRTRRELSERGRGLSGGQRQRLVLARALLTDSEVLLLDRPTSAVDAQTETRIAYRLVRQRKGRTTVVASSSPVLLAQADEVLFHDGTALLRGTHTELLGIPAYRKTVKR